MKYDRKIHGKNWMILGSFWIFIFLVILYGIMNKNNISAYDALHSYPSLLILWIVGLIIFPLGLIIKNGLKKTYNFFKINGFKYLARFYIIVVNTFIVFSFFIIDNPQKPIEHIYFILAVLSGFIVFVLFEWINEKTRV